MGKQHAHKTMLSKLRWSRRFDRKPPRKLDRFTYEGIRVDGRKAIAFFDNVAQQPLFKQAIICSNDQALSLVTKLNKAPIEVRRNIVEKWLDQLEAE